MLMKILPCRSYVADGNEPLSVTSSSSSYPGGVDPFHIALPVLTRPDSDRRKDISITLDGNKDDMLLGK